ncbi:MAG: hypothetical protein IKP96_06095 [Elusimicrobiaceae bacterium]|nr:hypothetical protein [Elusimicrobiaceae bacterium]
MFNKLFPHSWFNLYTLAIISRILFYIAFIVCIYASIRLGLSFIHASQENIGLRPLYLAACLQGGLFCLVTGSLTHLLAALWDMTHFNTSKN